MHFSVALWWAAHHRHHHRYSDQPGDPHSPHQHGFVWSHVLWITSRENFPTDLNAVRDLARFPELRFLNRFDFIVPVALGISMYFLGESLTAYGTSGWQMVVWGFFISTIALFHATCTINSLAHQFGSRRFDTGEGSRNNFWLALITFGEGWHNNHHYYPGASRQGFYWWEIDLTYWGLKVLSWLGIIWNLHPCQNACTLEPASSLHSRVRESQTNRSSRQRYFRAYRSLSSTKIAVTSMYMKPVTILVDIRTPLTLNRWANAMQSIPVSSFTTRKITRALHNC